MVQPVSEYDDIQAILRSGFGKLKESCFLLARIRDKAEAKAWLAAIIEERGARTLSYRVTNARHLGDYQDRTLQVAFTAQGLRKLGISEDLFPDSGRIHTFSHEFSLGMARKKPDREGHSRLLGDIGDSAPSSWDWGNPDRADHLGHADRVPDVLILLYADGGGVAVFQQMVVADIASGFEVFRVLRSTDAEPNQDMRREPFGFPDGISQPQIDWEAKRTPGPSKELEYGNLIVVGEFLLGYQNEYGLYTYRPLLDAERDPKNILAAAEDFPSKRDLGRNGTYLVLRELEQDVSSFWHFVYAQSPADQGIGLAEAMVGRRLSTGDPLVTASKTKIRGVGPDGEDIRLNNFTFDADPNGLACPFGAHIRRANPRTADIPGGRQGILSRLIQTLALKRGGPHEDLLSSSRFHRIIRRGRPYGAIVSKESALKAENPALRSGLFFIALNANISRQFEFVQNAWIVNSKFNGLNGESDPLLGNRVASPLGLLTDRFSLPRPTGRKQRIDALPQFITVRGGAYFFLPSIRAVRYLAYLSS